MVNKNEDKSSDMDLALRSIFLEYQKSSITLLQVVESLESYLTHEDVSERTVGIRFLGDILDSVASDKITTHEIKFMSTFLVDRLNDHHKIVPRAIYASLGLLKQKNILKEDVKFILRAIFKEVHCQCLLMTDRRLVYSLFKYCLLNRLEIVKEMQVEFILSFITAMDGEKDPRNLTLLFSFIPNLAQDLTLGNYAEDLFEVFAAYFPIEFHPPVDDPYGISPDNLLISLRNCFASTRLFAPFAIPLIREKIESDLIPAKIDSLLTLQTCCQNYSGESMQPFLLIMWPVLRQEVIECRNEEVEKVTFKAIESIVECVEREPTTQVTKDCINTLGEQVMRECLGHLTNPENRLMFVSANLLLAVSKNSEVIFNMVSQKVMDILKMQWSLRSEPNSRKNILIIMSKFIECGKKYTSDSKDSILNIEKFYDCLEESLSNNSDVNALKCFPCVLSTAGYAMTCEQATNLATKIMKILSSNNDTSLIDPAVLSLRCLSNTNESVVPDTAIPMLIDTIKKDKKNLKKYLSILSQLVIKKREVIQVMKYLWDCVDCDEDQDDTFLYIQSIASIVSNEHLDLDSQEYLGKEMNLLEISLFLSFRLVSVQASNESLVNLNQLRCLSVIVQYVAKWEDNSKVNAILQLILSNNDLSESDVKSLVSTLEKPEALIIAKINIKEENCYMVYPLEGLLLSCQIEASFVPLILPRLENWCLNAPRSIIREESCLVLSSVINRASEKDVDSFLTNLYVRFSKNLASSVDSSEIISLSIAIIGWVIKALVMRNYSKEKYWMGKLENLLTHSICGPHVAECYSFLLKDFPRYFSSTSGANVKFLYKQRIFESRIGSLVELFRNEKNDGKFNILHAISHLMTDVPSVVLTQHIEKLIPVICQGLTCPPLPVTTSCVSTLAQLLKDSCANGNSSKFSDQKSSCIASHVGTFVKRLLQLSIEGDIEVRVKSLECIELLSNLPSMVLVPYRNEVIRGLSNGLRDPKRLVRHRAASAKHSWVMGLDG